MMGTCCICFILISGGYWITNPTLRSDGLMDGVEANS